MSEHDMEVTPGDAGSFAQARAKCLANARRNAESSDPLVAAETET